MPEHDWDSFIRDQVDRYRQERDKAQKLIAEIENEGVSLYQSKGSDPMADVTQARLRELHERADLFARLVEQWEKRHA